MRARTIETNLLSFWEYSGEDSTLSRVVDSVSALKADSQAESRKYFYDFFLINFFE